MKKSIKIMAAVTAAAVAATGISMLAVSKNTKSKFMTEKDFKLINPADEDAIYFLNTGSSDAIILQSNGHFAMIDAGEDNDNPRGFPALTYKGYEDEIIEILKKTAADENGNVHLDFILGTHSHSDHIGGFDTIINDNSIFIDKAYIKEYRSNNIRTEEIDEWDNREVYDQMVTALKNKNIPIISDMNSEPFKFGNFTLTMLNTEYDNGTKKIGENDNSIVVLVEKDGKRALLTGDLDNKSHDEERIAETVGKIDLLKVGHHSYAGSTEKRFLKGVSPEVSIITNDYAHSDKRTLSRIAFYTKSKISFTVDEGGITAIFKNGEIIYTNHTGL